MKHSAKSKFDMGSDFRTIWKLGELVEEFGKPWAKKANLNKLRYIRSCLSFRSDTAIFLAKVSYGPHCIKMSSAGHK